MPGLPESLLKKHDAEELPILEISPSSPSHNSLSSTRSLATIEDTQLTDGRVVHSEHGTPSSQTPPMGHRTKWASFYVALASVTAAIGGVLFGYDVGIISGAILQLRREDVFDLNCIDQELVVSAMLMGAVAGSLTGGFIIDRYGRRFTIILIAVVFIIGAIILTFAPSYATLIVGRVVVGFAVSVSAIAECIYISEIAPPKRRGLLVSLNELGITLGLLLAYLINYIFINQQDGWRYMFGISVVPAVVQAIAMLFLPKSPRYLTLRHQDRQAERVLQKLRGCDNVDVEINTIRMSITMETSHGVLELFSKTDNMRGRMLIAGGLVFFQQVTGQPNVLYYAPTIFGAIGFKTDSAKTLATVGLGVVKVIATVISLLLIDRFGRRRLLLIGVALMSVSILLLGITTKLDEERFTPSVCHDDDAQGGNIVLTNSSLQGAYDMSQSENLHTFPEGAVMSQTKRRLHSVPDREISRSYNSRFIRSVPDRERVVIRTNMTHTTHHENSPSEPPSAHMYLSFIALMIFVAAYGFSFGPVTWLVMSEIFPADVKGRAIAIATVLNWGTNLLVSLTFLDLMIAMKVSWTFVMYAVICVISIVFIFTFVPETKNKSLEQISSDLRHSIVVPRTCCGKPLNKGRTQFD